MNIAEMLRDRALGPCTTAIIDVHRGRCRKLDFAELEQAAGRTATLLDQSGLEPGDCVLVFLPMCAELYVVLAAIFRLGLVAMFADPSAGRAHLEACCAARPPRGLIANARAHALRLVAPALRSIPAKFSVGLPVPGAVPLERARRLAYRAAIQACTRAAPALRLA